MPEENRPILDMSGDEYENTAPQNQVQNTHESEPVATPYVPDHSAAAE